LLVFGEEFLPRGKTHSRFDTSGSLGRASGEDVRNASQLEVLKISTDQKLIGVTESRG
jgi:hypothetical protein